MITNILGGLVAAAVALTSAAQIPSGRNNFEVSVGLDAANRLDLSALPCDPYYDGEYMMVPLRAVAEALGYKVSYNETTGEITVDDDYIQAATLKNGSANVTFKGHLQVIDMSREVELPVRVTIIGGHTYVPADFFIEFMNEVKIKNGVVTIAPQMAYIDSVNSYGAPLGR